MSFKTQLKHVSRRLMRSPMFTVVTLLTLGIGVGANTAIFSVINGILLKPLPYPNPERLAGVWQRAPGIGIENMNLSPSDYFTFREESRTFQEFGMWTSGSVSVTIRAEIDVLAVELDVPAVLLRAEKGFREVRHG